MENNSKKTLRDVSQEIRVNKNQILKNLNQSKKMRRFSLHENTQVKEQKN